MWLLLSRWLSHVVLCFRAACHSSQKEKKVARCCYFSFVFFIVSTYIYKCPYIYRLLLCFAFKGWPPIGLFDNHINRLINYSIQLCSIIKINESINIFTVHKIVLCFVDLSFYVEVRVAVLSLKKSKRKNKSRASKISCVWTTKNKNHYHGKYNISV